LRDDLPWWKISPGHSRPAGRRTKDGHPGVRSPNYPARLLGESDPDAKLGTPAVRRGPGRWYR